MNEMLQKQQSETTINEYKKETINDNYKKLTHCPFCQAKVVKRGVRKKKFETVQIYFCQKCNKRFTSYITKNKTYPLHVIIDAISLHNGLYSIEEIQEVIAGRYGIKLSPRNVLNWLKEYQDHIPFLRMREFASKKYSRKELIEESKLIHQQIYNFKYHRAKLDFILNEEFKHYKFRPLQELLELVVAECPHQLFQNTENNKRSSDFKDKNGKTIFDLSEVKIVSKNNQAVKTAGFIMQAVSNNKQRHEILQEFMLLNDSCTVAVEVPVLINNEDIRHYKHELNFKIPIYLEEGNYITGHIDLIQLRNGMLHIMDFKPSASKEKPISQLVLYALALSRLTGLRLYHFKCAWFDDKNYYEFFPLHVVYKLRDKNSKRIDRSQGRLG